jgi:hypothetical protein
MAYRKPRFGLADKKKFIKHDDSNHHWTTHCKHSTYLLDEQGQAVEGIEK